MNLKNITCLEYSTSDAEKFNLIYKNERWKEILKKNRERLFVFACSE